jgi:hypothetical protein
MKAKRLLEDFNSPMFNTLEKEKMNRVVGGYKKQEPCCQLNTYTVGEGNDGSDELMPGETQD